MAHPLLGLIATHPRLLVDHVQAYAELVADDTSQATRAWRRRIVLGAVAICCFGAALVLGGIAVMLYSVMPMVEGRGSWALVAVPLVPAALALWCWLLIRSGRPVAFLGNVRRQMRADMALLRDTSA
jgi:hypothetical protein